MIYIALFLTYTCLAKTEKWTYWGEKEYSILEPTAGDFSYLGWIVYADEVEVEVVVTNSWSKYAFTREIYNMEEDDPVRAQIRIKLESRTDVPDKDYFTFACFSVKDKDVLEAGAGGFAVTTMDDSSNHQITQLSTIEATSSTSFITTTNGWDLSGSLATGGGLSTTFEYTIYAQNEQDDIGIDCDDEVFIKCYTSPIDSTSIDIYNGNVNMLGWDTAEG